MKSRIMKIAADAVIVTAALIAVLQSGSSIDRAVPAYAKVSGNDQKYKTLTCKVCIPATGATAQVMALEPYYVRVEQPDGRVWLLDHHERKLILVNPAKKTAKIIRSIKKEPSDIYDTLKGFKNTSKLSGKQIGRRHIGQKQAIGFRVAKENGGDEVFVWLDPQTRLPIRIESLATNQQGQIQAEMIYSDIVFDVELDESLFELDLAGYEVEEVDSGCVDARLNIRY